MTSVFEVVGVSTVLSQHLEPSIWAEKCVHVLVVLQRSRHSSADSSAVEPPMSLMVPVVLLSPTRLDAPPLMLMSYMKHGAGVEGGGTDDDGEAQLVVVGKALVCLECHTMEAQMNPRSYAFRSL